MTLVGLAAKGLRYYWREALASAAGVAVAAAVICGSLIAGGSVQATVRRSLTARLGSITHVVVGPRAMTLRLARGLEQSKACRHVVPILLLEGTAANPHTGDAVPRVHVLGVPGGFFTLYDGQPPAALSGRNVLLSPALASDLHARVGDGLILHVTRPDTMPMDSLFARRRIAERMRSFRLECAGIAPQDGPGGFALDVETGARRTVLVSYEWLAQQMELDGRCHAILLDVLPGLEGDAVERLVHSISQPRDLGLTLDAASQGCFVMRSDSITLSSDAAAGLSDLSTRLGARMEAGSIMLATSLRARGRTTAAHYVIVGYSPSIAVPDDRIVLSQWLAEDLDARVGTPIILEWMQPSSDGTYPRRQTLVRTDRIVATDEAVRERWLVPVFPGITDARRVSDWDPPFPVDLRLVTQRDERFWERYRAAPRAFVSASLLQRMWGAGSGTDSWITAVRLTFPAPQSAGLWQLSAAIRETPRLLQSGPRVRDMRAEAETASQGSSDFKGLMLGMSIFLVASAVGLAASMMRLSAERRASQVGLMLAVGFRSRLAAVPIGMEGTLASLVGAMVGAFSGVLVAQALVLALNTWWSGAVASETIHLVVSPTDLVQGFVLASVLGAAAAWRTAFTLAGGDVWAKLAGWRAVQIHGAVAANAVVVPWLVLGLAAVAAVTVGHASAEVFLGSGACLLVSGLGLLHSGLRRALVASGGPPTYWRMAIRNASLHRGHSTLVAGMVAAASFIVVTVAANVRSIATVDVRSSSSGAGGFDLIVRSTTPLPVSMETPEGRRNLGFRRGDEHLFEGAEIVPLWVSDGVNTGCLNLARPTEPRIIGVTDAFIRRGGFTVQTRGRTSGNPWELLLSMSEDGTVPTFGDAESVRWILRKGLGQTVVRSTGRGHVRLRFDGLIAFSIFAGELLVSETQFRRMFPEVTGPSMFLVRAATPDLVGPIAESLRRTLGETGVEVRTTRETLNELLAVQNAYLAAFLVLGGLGVILGMAGLGAVVLRTAAERRSEFAILTAMGFRRSVLASTLMQESAGLLLYGWVLGTGTALVASLPRVASGDAAVNWLVLGVTLLGAMTAGLLSCVVAAAAALRGDVLAGLRWE